MKTLLVTTVVLILCLIGCSQSPIQPIIPTPTIIPAPPILTPTPTNTPVPIPAYYTYSVTGSAPAQIVYEQCGPYFCQAGCWTVLKGPLANGLTGLPWSCSVMIPSGGITLYLAASVPNSSIYLTCSIIDNQGTTILSNTSNYGSPITLIRP